MLPGGGTGTGCEVWDARSLQTMARGKVGVVDDVIILPGAVAVASHEPSRGTQCIHFLQ